jgi:cell division protein FtsW (lipid II flippase)
MRPRADLPPHLEERALRARSSERRQLALAAAFVGVSASSYSLVASGRLTWTHLWPAIAWAASLLSAHLVLDRYCPLRDPLLLPIVGLLAGWGLVLVDRLAPGFLVRQTVWVVMGTAALVLLSLWPQPRPGDPAGLRWLRRYRYTWLLAGLALLGLTLLFGVNPSGASLRFWLGGRLPLLGDVYFQPSELLKLLAVAFLASYMAEKGGLVSVRSICIRLPWGAHLELVLPPLAYLAPLVVMWGLSLLMLVWQRDLGAATLFFLLFLAMLYLASGRWEAVVSGLVLLTATVAAAYLLPLDELSIVRLRIDTWLHPWPEAQGRAFQIVQSLLALAAGGLLGQGVGQGFPTYIPVVHSDFAFAAVAEEWGLVGALTVVLCLTVLVYRGLRLAILARRPFPAFLAAGISALLGIQSLIIVGGVTKLLPLTGVTLPFLSYGGSSMLVSCMAVGFLIKTSSEALSE